MDNGYLCHLTFILFKFTLKNFIFLEMVSDTIVSPRFFHIYKYIGIPKLNIYSEGP